MLRAFYKELIFTPDASALAQLRKDCMEVTSLEESKVPTCDAGASMTLARQ